MLYTADAIDSMLVGELRKKYEEFGHEEGYHDEARRRRFTEFFANFVELYGANAKDDIKFLKRFFPKSIAAIEKFLRNQK